MSSFHQFMLQAKKARDAINNRARKSDAKKNNSSKHTAGPSSVSSSVVNLVSTSAPPWDLLPVEIQITIFAHCGVTDLLPLKLVCKSFHNLLTSQEQSITRQYLRQRRHGTLPSPIDGEKTYTRSPEDDVVLLSDLFPPAKSAKGGHIYTFKYISGLRRRQKLCSRLCCYLADRVMDRFVHSEPAFMKSMFSSKSERYAFVQRTTAQLWSYLTPLMYYTLHFLEAYALARREQTNALLRDWEAGRLPVPVPPHIRKIMYRELQVKIIRSPPFTDTPTLIATHHCMELLVTYLRYTVPPDEPTVSDDSWIGSLLTVSPFLRIVEYFSAEIGDGGNQRMQRKDFMHNFHNDITSNAKDDINSLVFQNAPNVHLHGSLKDVWFDVVKEELVSRMAAPHNAERIMAWNGLPILFCCQDCSTLLNTSWTLHRLSPLHHGKEFDSLLNNPLALKAYATRLRDQLSGTALSGGVQFGGALPTTEDDGLSRTGALKSCTWETVPNISFSEIEHESLESDDASDPLNAPRSRTRPRRPPHSPSPSHQGGGICVKLEYENITYKAALLTSSSLPASQSNPTTKPRTRTRSQTQTHSTRLPLLLTRFPAPLRQTFISFLSSTFDAYCSPLHLPPQFLGTALGTYIRALASEGLGTANPVNILKELHLTLSFSASVAPELRALNISIPRESLGGFLYAGDSGMGSESDVLSRLSAYLDGHLAMKLDLTGNATGPGPKGQQHVRLSRITCGGFSLGGDGKMKLVASPSTAGGDGEESSNGASSQTNRLALRACEVLLLDVVRRAAVDEDET
ncbi:hypothetical protein BO70DRAFT_383772 [Aspergillus heteromorphus CBS 117.55]|uniref:F-box domain-containing protein n=1 Tax=Aspergillus heteromorphus CBS 117.55 TaxID=1448321 RepID=A0A317X0D6_9EURO|nr:uncharacterized protein BO70DRAFT_383772 [Aspergillus heteromorphus CBS 117.55]PWY92104.1 hypothetical protein BO70DRAFT_383772 [Aspergillus heteromorphus CBS 117.55]